MGFGLKPKQEPIKTVAGKSGEKINCKLTPVQILME